MKEQTSSRSNGGASPNDKPMLLQRKCACGDKCDDCKKDKDEKKNVLQRFGGDRAPVTGIPQSVNNVLRTPGRPLDSATRARMEPRFGFDFSTVRIHADDHAHDSAHDVGALAYTVGQDVAFSSGHYRPGTASGDSLLAHELAHVVQQSGGGSSSSNSALEADADRSADLLTKSKEQHAGPRLRAAARLSKQPDPQPGKKKQAPKKKPAKKADDKQPKKQTSTTSAPPPPKPPVTPPEPVFEVAGKTKTHWRADKQLSYDSKQEAQNQRDHLKALRVKSDAPVEVDGKWTFDYYPLSKDEANAEQKTKTTAFPKFDITVEEDTRAKTFFLRTRRKCPQGIDAKGTFKIFTKCFPKESDAKALVKQFKDVHVDAETVKAEEDRWGVYFKPFTEAEAKKAGEAEANARAGASLGIYKVDTEEKKDLGTFTYKTRTQCPKDFTEVAGGFRLTAYILAVEKDYPDDKQVEAPGIKDRKFRNSFLYTRGVKMQGTGKALDGTLIHYDKDTNKFRIVKKREVSLPGVEATVGRTVAVDTSVIPLGSELIIEDVGARRAEDTGGDINGNHIDVYFGETKTITEAWKFELKNKKVGQKTAKP